MDVYIYTSDPDNVNPNEVKSVLESAGFIVLSVTVDC